MTAVFRCAANFRGAQDPVWELYLKVGLIESLTLSLISTLTKFKMGIGSCSRYRSLPHHILLLVFKESCHVLLTYSKSAMKFVRDHQCPKE